MYPFKKLPKNFQRIYFQVTLFLQVEAFNELEATKTE